MFHKTPQTICLKKRYPPGTKTTAACFLKSTKPSNHTGPWSSGYDVAFTRRMSPVRIRAGPSKEFNYRIRTSWTFGPSSSRLRHRTIRAGPSRSSTDGFERVRSTAPPDRVLTNPINPGGPITFSDRWETRLFLSVRYIKDNAEKNVWCSVSDRDRVRGSKTQSARSNKWSNTQDQTLLLTSASQKQPTT